MEYSQYPKYTDSDVAWLGEIPIDWKLRKLRFVLSENFVNGIFKKSVFWGNGKKVINVTDVYTIDDLVDQANLDRLECSDAEYRKYSAIHGDFFLVRSSLKMEGVGKSASIIEPKEEMVFECHLVRGRPDLNVVHSRFLILLLNSNYCRNFFVSQANIVTMATIDQEKFKSVKLPIPLLSEQTQIVDFLDYKTSKIDRLVGKKKALIEKLGEQRIAVITQAMTKGLNPDVPMRDSCVDWLGKVPGHWEVMKINHVVRLKSGESITSLEINPSGTYPVYGGNGLRGYFEKYTHDGTYVLIGRQGALCGNINYASERFWASEHAVVATPDRPLSTVWLGELLRVMDIGQYSVSAAQPGISVEMIGRLKIPYPPVNEQEKIAEFISDEISKIQKMVDLTKNTIKRLTEYRTALITAAVTGKIDVRGVKLPGKETI
jgi:type I restriction enzyme S subunit